MLRHIISVSLAMTACATLIPIKTNAATLTVRPGGELPRRPGDTIEFIFELNPAPSTSVTFKNFGFTNDANELELQPGGYTIAQNTIINTAIIVATRIFKVRTPVNDEPAGRGDVNAIVSYEQPGPSGTPISSSASGAGGDVVPVPEPLTIFGTATAFGCGVLFKRKSLKKTVS